MQYSSHLPWKCDWLQVFVEESKTVKSHSHICRYNVTVLSSPQLYYIRVLKFLYTVGNIIYSMVICYLAGLCRNDLLL